MFDRFRDLSVKTKVITAFSLVLAATVIVGVFAVNRLTAVDVISADVRDNWVPGMRYMATFQYSATRYRSFQHAFVLAKGSQRDADIKTLASLKSDADQALRDYENVVQPGHERELADHVRAAWNAYVGMQENLAKQYETGGVDGSAAYLLGPMRAAFGDVKSAVDALIAYNNEGAVDSGNAAQALFVSARTWILVAVALALLLCVFAGYALIHAVSKPMGRITHAMSELAAGHLNTDVPHADQADEVGKLAAAMATFKNQLAAAERSKAEQTQVIVTSIGAGLDHLAKGNLTHRVTAELSGPFAKLKQDFNTAMQQMQEAVKGVLAASSGIASGAGEISTAADDLSRRTEQQAASLEETAAALEEITASVKAAASHANEATETMARTKSVAEEGGRVVESAVKAMDAIAQSSTQITDIIAVIDEIAFQTNLLALNAGVEAARAGDAGKGFAVVASEVRALAQRSSEAAKQIKSLIKASSEQVGDGVKLVGESGEALKRIIDQVVEINGLARASAEAGQQQATGIEEVNAAVSSMDQATQQNAAMVEQSTAAARNLANETHHLNELIGFFHVGASAPAAAPTSAPRTTPKKVMSKPVVKPAAKPAAKPMAKAVGDRTAAAVPVEDDGWTEF